jgi:prevent-host-death family protein
MCDMTVIGHREMRNNSADVLRRVEAGESFTITNNGAPVADLTPVQRPILEDLAAKGQLRRALHGPEALLGISRVRLSGAETTTDVIADLRGYGRS